MFQERKRKKEEAQKFNDELKKRWGRRNLDDL